MSGTASLGAGAGTMRHRVVPLVVASPLFLQNIDGTAMVIALPSIAASLGVATLQLNLVVTTYLISLAVFLPMSAWLADRFGSRVVFCAAVGLFSLASALCGLSPSLWALVACRVLQGFGGAMMVPVGRLILLRAVPASEMVSAMVWYTIPPVIGRLTGPLIGGAIVSIASWHWIFFVNIPFGILAIALALWLIDDEAERFAPTRFDLRGFLLIALGLAALLGALEAGSKGLLPLWVSLVAGALGLAVLGAYVKLSPHRADPLIDLSILRFHTFRTNVIGAVPLRLALSAVPFLLPLMLQLGYGMSPMAAGVVAAASAFGALCTRGVMRLAIERFGFRRLLLGATLMTGLLYASLALLNPVSAPLLLGLVVFCGGLTSSLCMVLLNTLGFVEIPKERTSHATTLTTMAQQLMQGGGVVLAVMLLGAIGWLRHGSGEHQDALDYAAGLVAAGLLPLLSLLPFSTLKPDAGAELRAEAR